MNDAQPRPSETESPDGATPAAGAESGHNAPVLTRQIPPPIEMVTLLGPRYDLLRTMDRHFPLVDTHVRGNEMTFAGPAGELEIIDTLVDELLTIVSTGQPLNRDAVERSISMLRGQTAERPADVLTMNIVSSRGRTIRPKTLNQKRYVDAIDEHTVVFGIGPAGEAGERLGFLPGTLNDKIDPYLRPLYDALHDMVSPETIPRLMASGTIEVAPLAYMRGRTLNDAFIILDEAQNTSSEQMKMFLTRLGFGSKMVVTGDITQVDLPGGTRSGLKIVRDILGDVEDIHFAELTSHDVVRHRLVSAIVDAYERDDHRAQKRAVRAAKDATGAGRGRQPGPATRHTPSSAPAPAPLAQEDPA